LESSASTASSILLRFTTTGIGNKKIPIISHECCPQLVFAALINILGIIRNNTLRDSRTDRINLCSESSSLNSNTNVKVGELVLSKDENGLKGLQTEAFWLDVFDGLTIDLDEATTLFRESASGRGLLPVSTRIVSCIVSGLARDHNGWK